jgi:hypothetical protein
LTKGAEENHETPQSALPGSGLSLNSELPKYEERMQKNTVLKKKGTLFFPENFLKTTSVTFVSVLLALGKGRILKVTSCKCVWYVYA